MKQMKKSTRNLRHLLCLMTSGSELNSWWSYFRYVYQIHNAILKLTPDQHVDDAQQAFSFESKPCLHTGIPALEALHMAWKNCLKNPKFELFSDGLTTAMEKIAEYYEKTATSHAYTFVMCKFSNLSHFSKLNQYLPTVLDPDTKMSHFKKHWDKDLQDKVLESAEKIVHLNHPMTGSYSVDFFSFSIVQRTVPWDVWTEWCSTSYCQAR